MQWFWMNMPLAAIIFATWTGVPLWLVLKHPDTGPGPRVPDRPRQARVPERAKPLAADAYSHTQESGNQLLAGARR